MKTKRKKAENPLEMELAPKHVVASLFVVMFIVGFLFGSSTTGLKYDLAISSLNQTYAAQTARLLDSFNLTRSKILPTGTNTEQLAIFAATNNGVQSISRTGSTLAVPGTKSDYIVIEDQIIGYTSGGSLQYTVSVNRSDSLTNTLRTYGYNSTTKEISHLFAGSVIDSTKGGYIVIEDQIIGFFADDGSFKFAVSLSGSGVTTGRIVDFANTYGIIIVDDIDGI